MDFGSVMNIILPIVYGVVGLALIWFVIELVMTVRKARNTVTDVQKQLEPTLDSVQKITARIEPVTKKVDPLVDRVNLTVDAANLEIMRVDQILEDVTQVTNQLSKAANTVDTVTSAPVDLVNSMAKKVRNRFKSKGASDESVRLGQAKDAQEGYTKVNPVEEFVDAATDAAESAFDEQREKYRERKAQRETHDAQQKARTESIDEGATKVTEAALFAAQADTATLDEEPSSHPTDKGNTAEPSKA